jgi:hypothetical protein
MDPVESMALETRADVREMRSGFKKFRDQFNLPV